MTDPITVNSFVISALTEIKIALAAVGFGGGGIGLIKFIKHVPAPGADSPWFGAVFDTLQDMVSNNERIGERRLTDGTIQRVSTVSTTDNTTQTIKSTQPPPTEPTEPAPTSVPGPSEIHPTN